MGLGACWVSTFDEGAIERILKIPSELEIHSMIPLGYPAEKPNPPHRQGLEFFTYFDEYGNKEFVKRKGFF